MTDDTKIPEQVRIGLLLEFCRSRNQDPIEAMMDLMVAACAISINCRPLRPTQEILAESLPYALSAAEQWFPPAPASRVN